MQPQRPVVDYVTRYSGITGNACGRYHNLADAQRSVLRFLGTDTLLVGHGLENDLRALRLSHMRVVDTALLFGDERGAGFKPSLRRLAARFLNIAIQHDDGGGHDSATDAHTALRLVELKVRHGADFGAPLATSADERLLDVARNVGARGAVLGRAYVLSRFVAPVAGSADLIAVDSDKDALSLITKQLGGGVKIVCAEIDGVSEPPSNQTAAAAAAGAAARDDQPHAGAAEEAPTEPADSATHAADATAGRAAEQDRCVQTDHWFQQLHDSVPANTLVLVIPGSMDTRRVRECVVFFCVFCCSFTFPVLVAVRLPLLSYLLGEQVAGAEARCRCVERRASQRAQASRVGGAVGPVVRVG